MFFTGECVKLDLLYYFYHAPLTNQNFEAIANIPCTRYDYRTSIYYLVALLNCEHSLLENIQQTQTSVIQRA